jgi:predicted XRE-type DNA-binding protein
MPPASRKTDAMTQPDVHESAENIFAELGLPDADTHFLKAQIVAELYRITSELKLTQTKAGEIMGITQPEVSRLFRGTFREYSVERLIGFLTAFNNDVEIVVRPREAKAPGEIRFTPAA